MAEQWINEGPDKRWNPLGIFSWLQRNLSITTTQEPQWSKRETRLFTYWNGQREYVSYGVYFKPRPYIVIQKVEQDGAIVSVPVSEEHPDGLKWLPGIVSIYRAGWRVDNNMTKEVDGKEIYTYIWGMATKLRSETHPMELGY